MGESSNGETALKKMETKWNQPLQLFFLCLNWIMIFSTRQGSCVKSSLDQETPKDQQSDCSIKIRIWKDNQKGFGTRMDLALAVYRKYRTYDGRTTLW